MYFYTHTHIIEVIKQTLGFYQDILHKEIEYNPNVNNILNQACISSIYKEQSLRTNAFTHSS
ncbi:hypothetical protein CDX27_09255, partial [Campylobacter coli]|nr:hypothetical protein [Campylobacter coli]